MKTKKRPFKLLVSGPRLVSATLRPLYLQKWAAVRILQEAGWAVGRSGWVWWREKSLFRTGAWTPNHPARSVVSMLTTLSGHGSWVVLEVYFGETENTKMPLGHILICFSHYCKWWVVDCEIQSRQSRDVVGLTDSLYCRSSCNSEYLQLLPVEVRRREETRKLRAYWP